MERWLTIEHINTLTNEYKFVSNELSLMQRVWEHTHDLMCSPSHQAHLKNKLDNISLEIKHLSKSL